jgi:hypothetical protein
MATLARLHAQGIGGWCRIWWARDMAAYASRHAPAARVCSVLMALGALATGCATTRAPPSDLDLSRAAIVQSQADPVRVLNGRPGKGVSVGAGAVGGAGTGILVAAVGCLGAGPFYPLCLAVVLPASTAIGTLGGVMVGAVVGGSTEDAEAKASLLQTELAAVSYPALLAQRVRSQASDRLSIDLPLLDTAALAAPNGGATPANDGAPRWLIDVALIEVFSDGNMPDQPYALRVVGRLRLHRTGEPLAVYESSQDATSDAVLTTAEWGANGAEAVRSGLDQSVKRLAEQMLTDLARSRSVPALRGTPPSAASRHE